ncbi:response regulator [uncultured Arcobacter sp.]|uniref:response regulator n=1 Tax=uncultured Arcobacter sp. TaxID=165434 RepID=UPI0026363283|nr:response regulator [uncultured Arcobacter sp.]
MENINEFIKKLKVLYVENDDEERKVFEDFLNKKFETTTSCSNAFDGYDAYKKAIEENLPYDLIISNINMPKMSGIELLEKIREENKDVPYIFTTGILESEQMIKAINLNVNSYFLKPLDFTILDKNLETVCEDIYYKKNYILQKKETESYLSLLNKEAIVSKTDFEGNITFVNDAFLEVSGYKEDEVIGKNHNIVRHPDTPKSLFKELWETIKSGKTWEGTLRNLSKNNETYYINTKIIPVFDDLGKDIVEFISIRFLVTDEENQRRAQNKRYLEQVTTYKKEISNLKKEKEIILSKISGFNDNSELLRNKVITYENRIKSLLSQLEIYEKQNIEYSKLDLMMKQDKKKQFDLIAKQLLQIKTQNKSLVIELEDLKKAIFNKDKQIDTLEKKQEEHEKRISNLLDLVNNLQKEMKELKGEKSE